MNVIDDDFDFVAESNIGGEFMDDGIVNRRHTFSEKLGYER